MITLVEIKKSINEKLKFATGIDFILEKNTVGQLSERILASIAETRLILGTNLGIYFEWKASYKTKKYDEKKKIALEKLDDLLHAWLPEYDKIVSSSPFSDRDLSKELTQPFTHKGDVILQEKYDYYLNMINAAEKYLKSEDLKEFEKYFINVARTHNKLILVIYLISERRIIKFMIDDKKLILSTEHLIKDLKKIEIADDKESAVYFHYHGLHDPDILYMDNYEAAVSLRKEMSVVRENKFNYNKRLVP